MKKKLVLTLATLMCISLCACGGSDTTNGDNKEDGVTQTVTTEKEETEELSLDMTVEQMQGYYDTTKVAGTPRIEHIKVYEVDKEANTVTYRCNAIDTTSTKYTMEYQEGLYEGCFYRCIVVDNNTPDDVNDDIVAYVFLKWFD